MLFVMVQKVNKYAVYDWVLSSKENDQIQLLQFIATQLGLKSISEVSKTSGKSYNGIKNFSKTVLVAGKRFVITSEEISSKFPF